MYNDISAISNTYGANFGGVASFQFAPKEWLSTDVAIDVITGTVTVAPTLISGKAWLTGLCMDGTMEYVEKDKTDKGNIYIEAALAGVVNKDEAARAVSLATLRFHEFVVIYTDNNKQRRIIGNMAKGMSLAADFTTTKDPRGAAAYSVSLVHQMAEPAPIYAV